jgi:ubiquinone/menaquinone biosynthesis C-methylase UbiE
MYQEIHGLDLTASALEVASAFRSRQIETHLQNGDLLQMPYPDFHFDTVLLISILEHLKPEQLKRAFEEIHRVLRPGGQIVYGVPVERPMMVFLFRLMGYNIREHHFSTEQQICAAAEHKLEKIRIVEMRSVASFLGPIYQVGHFKKS